MNTVTLFIKKMNAILYSCLIHIYGCMATVVVVDGLGTRVLGKITVACTTAILNQVTVDNLVNQFNSELLIFKRLYQSIATKFFCK